jgi:hypothetical protein
MSQEELMSMVLGWCLATPHYVHCKPPLSKQLRLIWLPRRKALNPLITLGFKFKSLPRRERFSIFSTLTDIHNCMVH